VLTEKQFREELIKEGFRIQRVNGVDTVIGLRLKTPDPKDASVLQDGSVADKATEV
jgi:hypothetical protein